jgi:peptidyl-prolyl cis-trans isomerase A (cyclophilin A)
MRVRGILLGLAVMTLACGGGNGLPDSMASDGAGRPEDLSPEEFAAIAHEAIWEPSTAGLAVQAPDSFTATFETSAGDFEVAFYREWSPAGVDRIYHLTRYNFYAGSRFFRVNPGLVQFGMTGQPALDSVWAALTIPDDPLVASNARGTVSFAKAGPRTRSTQLFINRLDNPIYDTCCDGGFPPVGRVVSGMATVDVLYAGHGETPVMYQDSIMILGNGFLDRQYPGLDTITRTPAEGPRE